MIRKWILLFMLLLSFVGTTFFVSMKNFEAQKQPVEIMGNESRAIVFYREDCPDCQQIFPYLYARKLVFNDLVFVNMNSSENEKYIDRYSLKSVPTIVHGQKVYSGTSIKKFQLIIQ